MTISIIIFSVLTPIVVGVGFAIREYVLTKKVSTETEPVMFR